MNKIKRCSFLICLALLGIGIILLGAMDMQRASAAPQPEAWYAATPLPEPLAANLVKCADDPDGFYMVGGILTGNVTTDQLIRYDIDTAIWDDSLTPMPAPRRGVAAACYQGRIYVVGGMDENFYIWENLFIYDIATDTWTTGPNLPHWVWGAAMGAWDGKLYVVGGNQNGDPYYTPVPSVDVFDLASWEWTEGGGLPMPTASAFFASAQDGSYLYAVGGASGDLNHNVDKTQLYDMAMNQWQDGPPFTSARALGSLAVTSSHLYMLGGDLDGGTAFDPTDLVEELDLSTWPSGSWIDLNDPPPSPNLYPATACSEVLSGGEIWSVGGVDVALNPFDTNHYRPTEECADFFFGDLTREAWELGNHSEDAAHYVMPVVNNGTLADTYDVSIISTWVISASSTIGPVDPGEAALLMVNVEVPAGANPGDFDIAEVTITSQGDPNASDSALLTTSVTDWQEATNVPEDVAFQTEAHCPDDPDVFYILGGSTPDLWTIDAVYKYDATENEWTWLTQLPLGGGWGHSVACYDHMLYVAGSGFSYRLDVYDIATNTWTFLGVTPRDPFATVMGVWDGNLYLVGGTDEVNIYNIATQTWSLGPPMPVAVWGSGSAQAGPYLYLVGGTSTDWVFWDNNSDITLRLNMATNTWETGPSFSSRRNITAVAITQSYLYAMGGDVNHGERLDPTGLVEVLDLSQWPNGTWEDINQPMPWALEANFGGSCTEAMSGGEIWSVGGASGIWGPRGIPKLITIDDTYYLPVGEPCVSYGVDLPEPFEGEGAAGETVTYTLSITNTGVVTDYYTMEVTTTWNIKSSLGGPGPIGPGESMQIVIEVNIPPEAMWGNQGLTEIVVASISNPAANDTTTITTTSTTVWTRMLIPLVMKN